MCVRDWLQTGILFFTVFGDILAHDQLFFDEDDDDVNVFFNQLANVKVPGKKIGQYLKQLRPDSGSEERTPMYPII